MTALTQQRIRVEVLVDPETKHFLQSEADRLATTVRNLGGRMLEAKTNDSYREVARTDQATQAKMTAIIGLLESVDRELTALNDLLEQRL